VARGPAPAGRRACLPWGAPGARELTVSAWPRPAGWGACSITWAAAGQAEAMRAEAATAAATCPGLCCKADASGDGLRWRADVRGWADEKRDDRRCRAGGRDTAEPLVGRGECARLSPRAGRDESCGQRRVGAVRVQGDGITEDGRHTRWVLSAHQAALPAGILRLKLRER
jgi:hypothetical protein